MKEFLIENESMFFIAQVDEKSEMAFPSIRKLKTGRKSDVCSKINALHTLLQNDKVESYVEPCGGIGFSSKLIETMFDPIMNLNDYDSDCVTSLKLNIKNQTITNKDYNNEVYSSNIPFSDLLFFDFSNFTLNKGLTDVLVDYSHKANIFIFTDVFCYSLKPWNLEKYLLYLARIQNAFNESGKYIDTVYLYRNKNVALIKVVDEPTSKEISIIYETELYFNLTNNSGLFKKGH